jgi:hypothetical protein
MDLYDVDRHRRHVPVSVRLLPARVYVFVFWSNLREEGKVKGELGVRRVETVMEFVFIDFSVSKSSPSPRTLTSVEYFNGLGTKERRARVE